jgi:hypothetical protein
VNDANENKLTIVVLCPSAMVQEKFDKLNMFFSQANPDIRMKSTNNDKFLAGNTISTFDASLLLQEDNVNEEEYEMQRDFLENYLNVPISVGFTTYDCINLPQDLKSKLLTSVEIKESFAGRE